MTDEIKGLVEKMGHLRAHLLREADGHARDLARESSGRERLARTQADWVAQAASLLTSSDEARVRAEERIAHYRKRLEIDHCFTLEGGVSVEVDHDDFPDGIECRDETIRLQDENAGRLRAKLQASEALVRELVEGLKGIEADEYGDAHRELAQALILRAENQGSSRADRAASDAARPDCSAAQSLDGGEG